MVRLISNWLQSEWGIIVERKYHGRYYRHDTSTAENHINQKPIKMERTLEWIALEKCSMKISTERRSEPPEEWQAKPEIEQH